MEIRSRKLAKALTRILAVLLGLCIAGLVLLVPAMVFAFAMPERLAGDHASRINGNAFDPSQPMVAGTLLLVAIVFLAVTAFVLLNLRRIMATVAAGDPFVPVNAARLRAIAGAMAALLIAQTLASLVVPTMVLNAARIEGRFNFGLFLGTLVVLVLAEVFREGARLRADAEGTV